MAANSDEVRSARAEEEAEAWLDAIERTLKRGEIDAFRQWLKVSLNRKAILDRCRLWRGPHVLAVLAELIPVESLSRRVERNYGRLTLALFLAVSGLGFTTILIAVSKFWPDANRPANPLRAEQTLGTSIGGRRTLRLPDGGTMRLNTATQVVVSYGPRFRDVTLVRGEADFDVIADPDRPFRVQAGTRQIVAERDVARFNVRRVPNETLTLTVLFGQISVPAARSRAALSPALLRARVSSGDHTFGAGEGGVLGPGWQTTAALTATQLQERIAWQSGELLFADEPLEDVLAEVERYTPTRFVVPEGLRNLRVDARFRTGDVADVLRTLRAAFGIDARARADGTIELAHGTVEGTVTRLPSYD